MDFPELRFNEISAMGLKFVVSKKTPDAHNILNRLEKAYLQLIEDGEIHKP